MFFGLPFREMFGSVDRWVFAEMGWLIVWLDS